MQPFRSFASDNNAGVHPRVMEALALANRDHCLAYGKDPFTSEAEQVLKTHFGQHSRPYFVYLGTAANVLSIQALVDSYHAVLCADTAHINRDECGAPEKFIGCKLLTVPSTDGKIRPEQLVRFLESRGFEHHSQPRVLSLTQCTELGTVYTPEEIRALADFAHDNDMLVHMDGARLANAAAALGLPLQAITGDCGVDVLSFGGTKNGLMFGEVVVFFEEGLDRGFPYLRKQAMQLASKMRFIAVQFTALLRDGLWLESARHANAMARLLADRVSVHPEVRITRPVETNHVFASIPAPAVAPLQDRFPFLLWNSDQNEVRWMTGFDTTEKDIEDFAVAMEEVLQSL